MTFYEDLAPIDYFGRFERLRAVGWLGSKLPGPAGPSASDNFFRLCSLLQHPWEPGIFMGSHDCELCQFGTGPLTFTYEEMRLTLGVSNLFVPADDVVFVAPSLVVHYVDCHRYQPPEVFWGAVRACPPMGSDAYFKALKKAGGRQLAGG